MELFTLERKGGNFSLLLFLSDPLQRKLTFSSRRDRINTGSDSSEFHYATQLSSALEIPRETLGVSLTNN